MEGRTRDPIAAVGVMAEPTRHAVYDWVVARDVPVARDEVAAGVGIGLPLAAFHLDRLVASGFLEVEFRRRGTRKGPGAGRPAKLYRRSATAVEISIPARRYDLAAEVLAEALATAGEDALPALVAAARSRGRRLAAAAKSRPEASGHAEGPPPATDDVGRPAGHADLLTLLETNGFEPRVDPARDLIVLRTCPFDVVARDRASVACPMNRALLEGLVEGLGSVEVIADEAAGSCCVALRATGPA